MAKIKITENAKKLHLEFVRLGSLKLKIKNKMLAILPEIYKSKIWTNYAGSIIEYAGKYGDIGKTTVIKRLRLEENLTNLPHLKSMIEKVGIHKVAMVAKIATPATDFSFAKTILNMSKSAVQSLSKEIRTKNNFSKKTGKEKMPEPQSFPCKAVKFKKTLELDEEATFLFMKLKSKLGENLSDKEFIKLILKKQTFKEFKKSVTGDTFASKASSSIKNQNVYQQKSVTGDTFLFKVLL